VVSKSTTSIELNGFWDLGREVAWTLRTCLRAAGALRDGLWCAGVAGVGLRALVFRGDRRPWDGVVNWVPDVFVASLGFDGNRLELLLTRSTASSTKINQKIELPMTSSTSQEYLEAVRSDFGQASGSI
jgi:hypothetical protein